MEASANSRDAITAPIQEVLALFEGPLKGVAFPGVSLADFESSARKVEEKAREVEERATAVEMARATLEVAREALQGVRQDLIQQAQRALSYAKVYAEGNAELLAKLDGIQLTKPAKPRTGTPRADGEPPRRRGRKPKAQVEAEAASAPTEEGTTIEGQA